MVGSATGLLGDIWQYLLSQLGEQRCHWNLVGREWACSYHPTMHSKELPSSGCQQCWSSPLEPRLGVQWLPKVGVEKQTSFPLGPFFWPRRAYAIACLGGRITFWRAAVFLAAGCCPQAYTCQGCSPMHVQGESHHDMTHFLFCSPLTWCLEWMVNISTGAGPLFWDCLVNLI